MIPQEDEFAQFRPKPITEQEDDFANFRPQATQKSDYSSSGDEKPKKKSKPISFEARKEDNPDYAKQFIKETGIGFAGTYGDIAEGLGIQKDSKFPGQDLKSSAEFEVLEKMERGEVPSVNELMLLSEDEQPFSPIGRKLPTSEFLTGLTNEAGLKPKSLQGRYGARSGRLYGAGLAFGQGNPIAPIIAGTAAQTVEELGGGEVAQLITEFVALWKFGGSKAKAAISRRKEELKALGYADDEIALIESAAKAQRNEKVKGPRVANKSEATEQLFAETRQKSQELVEETLASAFPGIEKGAQNVKDLAKDTYKNFFDEFKGVVLKNTDPLRSGLKSAIGEIEKTVGENEKLRPVLNRLKSALKDLDTTTTDLITGPKAKEQTVEKVISLYQELGQFGDWVSPTQRDRVLSIARNSIKETLKAEKTVGKELITKFESANKAVQKGFWAEDIQNLVNKTMADGKIDFKKFKKLFSKEENVELFQKGLGDIQAKNLQKIADVGSDLKDFDKAWKSTTGLVGKGLDLSTAYGVVHYVLQGDYVTAATFATTKAARAALGKLAEKSLTDAKFQQIQIKLMHALKTGSSKSFGSAMAEFSRYLNDNDISF